MSKALNSPTARLLRASRLFSLPPPLPAASLEGVTASGTLRSSDTATLPYPTHQAISTPKSSRHRGDWGLKRPLPNRSIPKSNAHLRIKAIDNANHITEFASAADHTQTVLKWQDLNMPLTMEQPGSGVVNSRRATAVSAFEDSVDNTAYGSAAADKTSMSTDRAIMLRALSPQQGRQAQERQRWKTEGPWVNSLTEEEFQQYLANTVRKHKAGFLRFVEHVKVAQKQEDMQQRLRDEGLLGEANPQTLELELAQASKLDEHELDDFIKELRDGNAGLSSPLSALVRQYFDLPAFPSAADSFGGSKLLNTVAPPTSSDANPPATHPSAGLSYLRTRAFVQNHPVYGPQETHEPVQARVIRPRAAQGPGPRKASIGVAGFVTEEENASTFSPSLNRRENLNFRQQTSHLLNYLDIETPGGNKIWVSPATAHVDDKGHIQLKVQEASPQAVGVKTGDPVEAPEAMSSYTRFASTRFNDPLDARPPPGTAGNANYGRALPDDRSVRQNARPFDAAELEQAASGDDQIKVIEALARAHRGDRK